MQEEEPLWEEEEFEDVKHLICFWEQSDCQDPPENWVCGLGVKDPTQKERCGVRR